MYTHSHSLSLSVLSSGIGSMSHGLMFSLSLLSQLETEMKSNVIHIKPPPLPRRWAARGPHLLDAVTLEQAVGVLHLEGLLTLHRPKPPGVINDTAEAIAWRARDSGG